MSTRRSLVEIQERILPKDNKLSNVKKSVTIYEDKLLAKGSLFEGKEMVQCGVVAVGCQTDFQPCSCDCLLRTHYDESNETTDEAYRLLIQKDVPEEYWKVLAERRREALNDSLRENEELHNEISLLKDENKRLSEVAEHADYFASILKELTEGDPNDSGIQGEYRDCQSSESSGNRAAKLNWSIEVDAHKEQIDKNID